MKRVQEDPDREDRIQNEAVVDAYDEEERAMGWYYYIEDKLHCPFKAKCISKRIISPLEDGEKLKSEGWLPKKSASKRSSVK